MSDLSRSLRAALFCSTALLGVVEAQTVTIAPQNVSIGVSSTQQFTAKVTGLTNTAVTWSVAGKTGGDSTNGTISPGGLYTAPSSLPPQNPVTVRATASDGKTSASTYVLLEALGPNLTSVSPNPIPVGSFNITVTGTGFVTGAQILVGGIQLSTTFVSSTTLKAAGYQPQAQSVAVVVRNPGTLPSNTLTVPVGSSTGGGGTIRISPAATTVALGATQQFTATGQSTVFWSASAGTITSTGLYTAPSVMPASNIVTIEAAGMGNQAATATVTLIGGLSPITVLPAVVSVTLGSTQQFTASGQTNVTWSASAGSISPTGLYTAPATMPMSSTVTITATGSGSQTGTATVTLLSATPITVQPATATVTLGGTQQFTAPGQNVSWSASAGTITARGLFTAPAVMPASNRVTITAKGSGGQSGTATVTLALASPVTVSPSAVTVALGATQQFSAAGQPSVTWSATAGTISSTGLYTAPSAMPASSTVIITATGTGNQSATATVTLVNSTNNMISTAAAHRFLKQAAFGPTPADVAHVQAIGFQAWLNEQFAMPKISNYSGIASNQGGLPNRFLTNAVMNADQLRQRVAFALSQICVISITKLIWNGNVAPYEEMLANDAFTNYRQILGDVTLSPSMGGYLDMANNGKADPTTGTVANENYAREIMQLFSIGTSMLNPDGSRQTDASGNLIPRITRPT